MLARLLAILPAWVTGQIGPRARKEVRSWTKNNATLRTLRYGWFRRFLIWSTEHPAAFALVAGATAAGIAYLTAVQEWTLPWRLPAPKLKEGFDVAAYSGVPWSVQATLVALVYPIVLSFIALMLQRKAHSTAALRAYVLDSAVVPAGASSIGLLVVMGGEYFATPYSSPPLLAVYIAPLLVLNGAWLLINVLLTGFFLSRTMRFIQEEEQRHVFTRVAVDVALRSELTSAVKQHVFVNAAQSDWGFPEYSATSDQGPQVLMFASHEGQAAVTRDLKGSMVLHDVHLRLLNLVAQGWCRRAARTTSTARGKTAALIFPPRVGEIRSGEEVLCTVENGPPLNSLERVLVRAAFWYRPSRQGTLSLSTKRMLEEIGGEVEAAAEQQRFGAAEERLRDVLRLHKTLLLASAADSEGVSGNAATIGTSPYSWGDSSFDMEWLKPYRDIGRIAVNRLDEDARLFRRLAVVPASIVAELPPRPEKLLIDAQLVGTNLAYQLAGWWTRKADASLLPGATSFSGTLPAPLSKVYEQAVVSFIGSWGHLRVNVPEANGGDDAKAWQALQSKALVYAKHIENSAHLFLKAVSRGDETGSTWLLDNLLKWWGNRQYELECADIEDDFRVRHVTMTLTEKDWSRAQAFLWDGSEPITVDFGRKALNLAIRRYWESMRLYVVLLLIQNAGLSPAVDSRELRHAAALIKGTAQRAGGAVDIWPLDSIDSMLRELLGEVFGVETAVGRIDSFAEKLRWESEAPEVSGWIYSWSGTPTDLDSMRRSQAVLLVSLTTSGRQNVNISKRLIERWWRDIDKLESVGRYFYDLRRDVLSGSFAEVNSVISTLQALMKNDRRIRAGRLALARAARQLREVAQHERRITLRALPVAPEMVCDLGKRIAAAAFDASKLPPPLSALHFVPRLVSSKQSVTFEDDRKRYLSSVGQGADVGLAEHIGDWIRQSMLDWAFNKTVARADLKPVNSPTLRDNYEAACADMQEFILAVSARCSALWAVGETPVVLVGQSAAGVCLRPYKWGPAGWQCSLPANISIRPGKAGAGHALINDTPVFEYGTPNGDCFVVPDSLLKTLAVAGSDATSALSITWSEVSDDRLRFTISWSAEFK